MSRHTVNPSDAAHTLCGRDSRYLGTEPNGTPCRVCARVAKERERMDRIVAKYGGTNVEDPEVSDPSKDQGAT